MKIECLILLAILSVSTALEFNETTTAIATTAITSTTIPAITKNKRIIKEFNYTDPETLETCSLMVRKYPGGYLRGVKYPNSITVNGTMSLKECHMRCCFEERFECKSYSYFISLKQCFLMNVTKNFERAELIYFADWIHFQVMTEEDFLTTSSPEEETTTTIDDVTTEELEVNTTLPTAVATTKSLVGKETTTLSEDGTTEKYVIEDYESTAASEETTQFAKIISTDGSNNVDLGPDEGTFGGGDPSAEKMVGCLLDCSGHGKCENSFVNEDGVQTKQVTCRCEEGYGGEGCEESVEEKEVVDAFQPWMIAVIVIGILILILIVIACVLWRLYKQKGEYRVVDYIRRWTRRDKKPTKPDNPDEIAHMDGSNDTYPTIGRGNNGYHEESTRTAV